MGLIIALLLVVLVAALLAYQNLGKSDEAPGRVETPPKVEDTVEPPINVEDKVESPSTDAVIPNRIVDAATDHSESARPIRKVSGSDIFISYAGADRETARTLARALSEHGWAVWWDRTIPPGKAFDEVIESALDSARCVVVLWSRASVSSRWVKSEADEGARRQVLVPVVIQEVRIPLAFRHIQAAKLVDWNGSSDHPEFEQLVSSITGLLGHTE